MPFADWTGSSNLLFIGMDTARTATFRSGSTDRHEWRYVQKVLRVREDPQDLEMSRTEGCGGVVFEDMFGGLVAGEEEDPRYELG